ncbi:response regulator transcription factor [Microbacterium sp. RU33B]|uniref:response regulator transcription factor n=1 Tax=Microbacterium sp. RU33B TaxID=1907390 RepID=UPI00095B8B01|nr:response regulator transcription factor [Microbacterium sp. RU33B]SIT78729.1 DNA-binding response regulator, OmpR family, contains REC and winged-helix (wHTH) domain [Microbacterium sp. RU33B]
MSEPTDLRGEARPRLLYVEDEGEIAQIVVEVLSEDYDVDHAASGEDALTLALRRRYDVMVVDRRLPVMSGVELLVAIRTARIATPALMLTALGSIDDRVSGLDGGADDYLVKPFDFAELLARLRALRRGSRAIGDRREIGSWIFTPRTQALYSPTERRVSLTTAETELLELLTSSPEHVFTREEVVDAVFPGGSPATVDTYVHYIRRKATPEIIDTVRSRGYRSGDPS